MSCLAQRNLCCQTIGATLALWFAFANTSSALPPPSEKEAIRVKAKPAEPGSYYGPHSGNCLIITRSADGQVQVVLETNLKKQLEQFWNLACGKAQDDISKQLNKPDYYDKKVTIAQADDRASLHLGVSPSQKQVALSYLVMGHAISFKKKNRLLGTDKLAPDSSIHIRFDLQLIVVLRTNGPPSAPLVLDKAEVKVGGVRASVDGNWLHDLAESAAEFVGNFSKYVGISIPDFEATIVRSFSGATVDVKNLVSSGLQVINSKLTSYTERKGYFLLPPIYDKSSRALVLELGQPRKIEPDLTKPRISPKIMDKSKLPSNRTP